MKTKQLISRLESLNPGLEFRQGGNQHWKIIMNGRFIGILPLKLSKEGLALNTRSQLRRAGVRIS